MDSLRPPPLLLLSHLPTKKYNTATIFLIPRCNCFVSSFSSSSSHGTTLDLRLCTSEPSICDQRPKYFPIPVSIPSFSESGEFLATVTADPGRWRRGVDTREAMCECERWAEGETAGG